MVKLPAATLAIGQNLLHRRTKLVGVRVGATIVTEVIVPTSVYFRSPLRIKGEFSSRNGHAVWSYDEK